MRAEDLVLVSVDDHVVEPAHLFEGRVPSRYADLAPRFVHKSDGTDAWAYDGLELPNIGLTTLAPAAPRMSTATSPPRCRRFGPAATKSTSASKT